MVQLESILQFLFNFLLRCFRSLSLGAWGFVVKQFLYGFVTLFLIHKSVKSLEVLIVFCLYTMLVYENMAT